MDLFLAISQGIGVSLATGVRRVPRRRCSSALLARAERRASTSTAPTTRSWSRSSWLALMLVADRGRVAARPRRRPRCRRRSWRRDRARRDRRAPVRRVARGRGLRAPAPGLLAGAVVRAARLRRGARLPRAARARGCAHGARRRPRRSSSSSRDARRARAGRARGARVAGRRTSRSPSARWVLLVAAPPRAAQKYEGLRILR